MPAAEPAQGRTAVSPIIHQASCVAIAKRALLIEGSPGIGKSSLALALIDRGAALVGDDGVTLESRNGTLWASPPPNTASLLEIRNVGIVSMPARSARVALIIALDRAAPRFVDTVATREICGVKIPAISLYPDSAVLPLRAEWALKIHGTD